MNWINLVLCIIAGVATAIPLIAKLIFFVKTNIREKNWGKLLNLVMILMGEAEDMFVVGAEKKEWVLKRLQILSSTLDYDIDMDAVSDLIDSLCAMSKTINVK